MGRIFEYEIPVLHPLAVHFPLAFLIGAAGTALAWLVVRTPFWRRTTAVLLGAGSVGAAMAYFTGEAMEEHAAGIAVVEELAGLHERLGLATLLVATLAFICAAAVESRHHLYPDRRESVLARTVVIVATMAAAILVAVTGHVGSLMVWGVAA